jgi:DNA-binding NarL/FixJ family response regulator
MKSTLDSPVSSPAPADAGATTGNKAIKPVRVLIVEDHVALRQLLAAHLAASACYEVVGQVASGSEVAAACATLQPNLLILDLDLPDVDGLDVVTDVRTAAPETQILIFSALTDAGTVRRALETGACGFVEKTAGVNVLDRAIAAVSLGQPFFGDHILQTLPAVVRGQGEPASPHLSPRECEILALVANGHSSKEIAAGLHISVRTVENHRSNIMHSLKARNTADLTREAMRLGLVAVNRKRP